MVLLITETCYSFQLTYCTYPKFVSTNTSQPWHLQIAHEKEIGRFFTVTFWRKIDFLISNRH